MTVRRFGAGFPRSRANFAIVVRHVLRGLDLAQQLAGGASYAEVMHFHHLDYTIGIDDEGAAQCQSFFLDHDAEVARDATSRVRDHREFDLFDRGRMVLPGLVRVMRVRRHRASGIRRNDQRDPRVLSDIRT